MAALRTGHPKIYALFVWPNDSRSEEHTSELQSRKDLVCRLLLEKKKYNNSKKRWSGRKEAVARKREGSARISLTHDPTPDSSTTSNGYISHSFSFFFFLITPPPATPPSSPPPPPSHP